MDQEGTLVRWLEDLIEIEELLALLDDIDRGYAMIKECEENPNDANKQEIEFIKEDIAYWEDELGNYRKNYLEDHPEADWNEEVENLKKWYKEEAMENGEL